MGPEEIKFSEINTSEFVKQGETTSMNSSEQVPVPPTHDDPVQFSDTVTYISVYFDGEERLWYPGIVTKYIDSKSCENC